MFLIEGEDQWTQRIIPSPEVGAPEIRFRAKDWKQLGSYRQLRERQLAREDRKSQRKCAEVQ